MPTSANSSAAYVHMYSLIAAESDYSNFLKKIWQTQTREIFRVSEAEWFCVPRTMAKTDAKRPNVSENGAAM